MTNENTPGPATRHPEPLGLLWRGLAAPQTLVVLLVLIAVALILGSLVPHIPSAAREDPETWLAVQSGLLGGSGSPFRVLEFYDLSHAFWFRLLLAVAGMALFVRLVDAAERAWLCGRGMADRGERGFLRPVADPLGELRPALPREQAEHRARGVLDRLGYRRLPRRRNGDEMDGAHLLAGRRLATMWAQPVALGLALVTLAALAVTAGLGWQSAEWTPAPGEVRAVGHGTPYALRLDRFDVGDPDADDPGSARAQIAWLEGDAVAGQGSTYLGNPARFRGLQVQLLSYVPDVTLRGWDGEGRPLVLQQEGEDVETSGAVEILFATVDAQPQFFVPTQDLFLTLSFQAQCEGGRPALQITASRGTASGEQYSATLYESGDLLLADLRLAVALAYRPVLRTDRHPGAGWALGASALALLTLAVAWVLPPQLVEIALSDDGESGITMRVATVPGAERQRWLQRFLRDLTGALANDD